jgi:uncharacterized membrane protein YgcG
MRFLKLLLACFLLAAVVCPRLSAQGETNDERILAYDSQITLHDDGSLLVAETIKVRALGQQIIHGIYRDFPTHHKDHQGQNYNVPFDVMSVLRDGTPEAFHVEGIHNGKRVVIGRKGAVLAPGEYVYQITYQTARQIGFFPDHDELYWNVTGNGWPFPIDHATATVTLPAAIPRRVVETYGYTGPEGYTGRDFKASKLANDDLFFETKASLNPRDGFTIVAWWDKGYMQQPSTDEERYFWIQDNAASLAGYIGLALILIYQLITWLMVGRDPQPGTIVPQYLPPDDLSPAGVREIVRMGFDNRCFAAEVVGLAAKNFLRIEQDEAGKYTLVKTNNTLAARKLTDSESSVARGLFPNNNRLLLSPANHEIIGSAIGDLKKLLSARFEKIYFVRNSIYVLPSLILTAAMFIAMVMFADNDLKPVALFMCLWLSGWTAGVIALSAMVINLWKAVLKSKRPKMILSAGGALFMTLFALPFLAGEVFGIGVLANSTSSTTVIIMAVAIASNFLYHELLKAPTRLGRVALDKIDGFKLFLAATEEDQIKRLAPINWNLETFNKYLPYAVALDIEDEWSAKFNNQLAAAVTSGTSATSAGYVTAGAVAAAVSTPAFTSAIGDALTSAISSSTSAPGSSSGAGGGGSSGGGGGGGGGGGW